MRRLVLSLLAVAALAGCRAEEPAGLDGLPAGFVAVELEEEETEARTAVVREALPEADDIEVKAVSTPLDQSPFGAAVVRLRLRRPVGAEAIASRLDRLTVLEGGGPCTVAGRAAWCRAGDDTLSSSVIWSDDRRALLVYGSTTAEVQAVLAAVLGPTVQP